MNGAFSFYDCRMSGVDTQRWWRHSNPTYFLHSQLVGMLKHHPNGSYILHLTGNITGTGTGMDTIENNGLLSLPSPSVVCTIHSVI